MNRLALHDAAVDAVRALSSRGEDLGRVKDQSLSRVTIKADSL
jgi:hypothetical protein